MDKHQIDPSIYLGEEWKMLTKKKNASKEKRIQYGNLSLPTAGNKEMFDVLGDIRNTRPGNHPLATEKHPLAYAELEKPVDKIHWEKNPDGLLWIPSGTGIRNR
jgi:hypothetical protein